MVLPGLDGSFGGIAAVTLTLEGHVVLFEDLFEFVGAFVVDDV
jgi:hypothetical protein